MMMRCSISNSRSLPVPLVRDNMPHAWDNEGGSNQAWPTQNTTAGQLHNHNLLSAAVVAVMCRHGAALAQQQWCYPAPPTAAGPPLVRGRWVALTGGNPVCWAAHMQQLLSQPRMLWVVKPGAVVRATDHPTGL